MPNSTIAELTTGLLNASIEVSRLFETVGIVDPLASYLTDQLEMAQNGNTLARKQFEFSLEAHLIQSHALDFESEKSYEAPSSIAEFSAEVGTEIAKTHIKMLTQNASPVYSHIPILTMALFANEKKDYKEKLEQLTTNLHGLIHQVELDCKIKIGVYGLLSECYQKRLNTITDPSEREKLLKQWEQAHNHFADYIKQSQQNIAILGAKIQEANSQDRYKDFRFMLDLTSAGLHAIGPVGTAIATAVVGVNSGIGLTAGQYTSNSAKSNHLVLPNTNISVANDKELLAGLDKIRYIDTAIVHLNAPVITDNGKPIQQTDIPRNKLDIEQYANKLAQQMLAQKPPCIACRFPPFELSTSLPNSTSENQSPLKNHLDQLHNEQKELQRAYIWYIALTNSILKAYPGKDFPHVTNLEAIARELQHKSESIDQRLTLLDEMNRTQLMSPETQHVANLIKAYQQLTHQQNDTLQKQILPMRNSGYANHFAAQDPLAIDALGPQPKNVAAWQHARILAQLEGLDKLLIECANTGGKQHIANLSDLVEQIQAAQKAIEHTLTPTENAVIEKKLQAFDEIAKNQQEVKEQARSIEAFLPHEFDPFHYTNPETFVDEGALRPTLVSLDPRFQDVAAQQHDRILAQLNGLDKLLVECINKGGKQQIANLSDLVEQIQAEQKAIDHTLTPTEKTVITEKLQAISEQARSLEQLRSQQSDPLKPTDPKAFEVVSLRPTLMSLDPRFQNFATWQHNHILAQLDQLDKLLIGCTKMGNGRQIANLPDLIKQIQAEQKTIDHTLTPSEKSIIAEKLRGVVDRALNLEEARLHELVQFNHTNPRTFDAVSLRRELLSMETRLHQYPVFDVSIARLLDQTKAAMAAITPTATQEALSHISPIDSKQLYSNQTVVVTPSRLEFGWSKHADQQASVDKVVDDVLRAMQQNSQIKNIQIFPLQPINRDVWLSTRGDEKKMADAIEGLKTEMQWVNLFCSAPMQERLRPTVDSSIDISNLAAIREHYATQIAFIRNQLTAQEDTLNASTDRAYAAHHDNDSGGIRNQVASLGTALTREVRTSTVGKMFLQNAEEELKKCEQALAELDLHIAEQQKVQERNLAFAKARQQLNAESMDKLYTIISAHPELYQPKSSSPDEKPQATSPIDPLAQSSGPETQSTAAEKTTHSFKEKLHEAEHGSQGSETSATEPVQGQVAASGSNEEHEELHE